jgi:hypothetical protein
MKNFNPKEYKKACDSAIISHTIAYLIFKRIPVKKLIVITCMLFICIVSFSQNFKSVAKFGMTKQQIADTCAVVAWCRASNDFHGEPADIYTGLDFNAVMFVYNKSGKCYKIMIKNSTSVVFDKQYKVIVGKENGMFVYTVQQ